MQKLVVAPEFFTLSERALSTAEAQVLAEARKAALNAHAPYSQFFVGAAVQLETGEIVSASNQENASYPSGMCAERVVLNFVGATHPKVKIKTLCIAVVSELKDASRVYAPCGGCRQVISETQARQNNEPIDIIFEGPGDQLTRCCGIEHLLPFTFQLF
jgi:cytidine deaminase